MVHVEVADRLGKALAIPLRDRNRLLELAGLAASYHEGDLTTDDLAPFRAAIDRLLDTHEPYPAYVVDRHWELVETNRAAVDFLPGLDAQPADRLALWSQYVANLSDVAPAFLDRIAADLHRYPDDDACVSCTAPCPTSCHVGEPVILARGGSCAPSFASMARRSGP